MKPDLVLIDDDELIQEAWKLMAQSKGHNLVCFDGADQFDFEIPKDVPVYVDYLMDNKPFGTEFSRRLIETGYQRVYITTGVPENSVVQPQGLQGVIGKNYPFGT